MEVEKNSVTQFRFPSSQIRQNRTGRPEKTQPRERKESGMPKKAEFASLLNELIPQDKEPELHELWSQFLETEQELIRNPVEANLEKYAGLVKRIAQLLIQKNTRLKTLKRKTASGKEILLTYVEVIDEKLQKMVLAIQSKKNTAFEILRNLYEIRGLLFDLKI